MACPKCLTNISCYCCCSLSSLTAGLQLWGQALLGTAMVWSPGQGPLTPPSSPAPQPVGVLPVAQVVDEGAQGLLVTDMLCDHHLLLDDIRLRQVGPSLQRE